MLNDFDFFGDLIILYFIYFYIYKLTSTAHQATCPHPNSHTNILAEANYLQFFSRSESILKSIQKRVYKSALQNKDFDLMFLRYLMFFRIPLRSKRKNVTSC